MSERIALEPVDRVEVTVLVDNAADMLLRSEDRAQRPSLVAPGGAGGARLEAPLLLDGKLADMLVAEHGFSALVAITTGGRTRTLLFDAGLSVGGLAHNMAVMQVRLADIEAAVLSHGHFDHISGLNGLVRDFGARRLPMLLHPDFWLRRRITIPNSEPLELPAASRAAVEGAGFEVIEDRQPSLLLDGAVLITGEVGRGTDFETGFPMHQARRNGDWEPDPLIMDDQALIANVRGKGLVVLTGCGHAGVVNILRHAQQLTGEPRVAAIAGGFHLGGPLFEPRIAPTIAALKQIAPAMVVPGHCTGFAAARALADALPDAFVLNSVGTRYVI